jgi:hypothetical protein
MSPYVSRGQYDNLLDDDDDLDEHYVPPPPLPTHYKRESGRSSISFSSPNSTFSRVNLGSLGSRAQKKRKRLVISGVGVHETRKFEGVKQWCEVSFFARVLRHKTVPKVSNNSFLFVAACLLSGDF